MDFSWNNSNEDFNMNNTHQSLIHDDASYIQKNHPNFFIDDLGQSSMDGWSQPPFFSDNYQQNQIQNQYHNSLNWNFPTTQNHPVYNLPIAETPSKYSFMDMDLYSRLNPFEDFTNNNNIHMAYNTNPMDIFNISHDFSGNIMWNDVVHKDGLMTCGYEPTLDEIMVGSEPFDLFPAIEGIENTSEDIINPRDEDHKVMIETDQKKNKNVVRKRRNRLRKTNSIKEKWTESEDEQLKKTVKNIGAKNWSEVAKFLNGRLGKQCRERWHNHLRPDIKKDAWTEEEDQILIEAHKVSGNKWKEIAQNIPGRSENNVKNHWNATKRRIQSKTKRNGEIANPPHSSNLGSYIENVTINNVGHVDHVGNDFFYGDINFGMNIGRQTAEPLVDQTTTTSVYVPVPTTDPWENQFADLFDPIDGNVTQNLMDGWE